MGERESRDSGEGGGGAIFLYYKRAPKADIRIGSFSFGQSQIIDGAFLDSLNWLWSLVRHLPDIPSSEPVFDS